MKKYLLSGSIFVLSQSFQSNYNQNYSVDFTESYNVNDFSLENHITDDKEEDNYLFIINRLKKECIRKHFNDILLFP